MELACSRTERPRFPRGVLIPDRSLVLVPVHLGCYNNLFNKKRRVSFHAITTTIATTKKPNQLHFSIISSGWSITMLYLGTCLVIGAQDGVFHYFLLLKSNPSNSLFSKPLSYDIFYDKEVTVLLFIDILL